MLCNILSWNYWQVTYSVKYNYSLLKENATDAIIANTIGNVTYVTEGLNTTDFQDNYNVSDVSITGGMLFIKL